jgi:KTSC domain-containing protein
MLEMFPVVSSRISEMGYDRDTATLYVRFPGGKSWQYRNVPPDVWDGFVQAASKGQYIKEVLDHYDHGPADI